MIHDVVINIVRDGRGVINKTFVAFRVPVVRAAIDGIESVIQVRRPRADSAVESVGTVRPNNNRMRQKIYCRAVAVVTNKNFCGFCALIDATRENQSKRHYQNQRKIFHHTERRY